MTLFMRFKFFLKSLAIMLGKNAGGRPQLHEFTPAAIAMHKLQKSEDAKQKRRQYMEEEKKLKPSFKWRNRRWATLIALNATFMLSYWLDVQLVEGSMTASRVMGFHFADLNSALQVMLAHKEIVVNLLIGTGTVLFWWFIFGGRSFCSWACPYHLLSEFAEKIHLKLRKAKWIPKQDMHRGLRTFMYIVFLAAAFFSGYTVYEAISPTGIVSRALIYGPGLALIWILGLLMFEIFISRRAWCRYMCPVGMTYGFLGAVSPLGITYNLETCVHEGECLKVCLVPHVLQCVKIGHAYDVKVNIGGDCTRCGMCVDTCPTGSLKFKVKIIDDLL